MARSRRERRTERVVASTPDLTLRAVASWDRKARRRVKRLGPDAAVVFGGPEELADLVSRGVTKDGLRLLVEAKQHRLRVIFGEVE